MHKEEFRLPLLLLLSYQEADGAGGSPSSALELEADASGAHKAGKHDEKGQARSASDTLPAPVSIRGASPRGFGPRNSFDDASTPRVGAALYPSCIILQA